MDHVVHADQLEHLGVVVALGLGPDVADLQLGQQCGGEDAGFDVRADPDDRVLEVADADPEVVLGIEQRHRAVADIDGNGRAVRDERIHAHVDRDRGNHGDDEDRRQVEDGPFHAGGRRR